MKKMEMDECKFMSGGEPGYGRKANRWGCEFMSEGLEGEDESECWKGRLAHVKIKVCVWYVTGMYLVCNAFLGYVKGMQFFYISITYHSLHILYIPKSQVS